MIIKTLKYTATGVIFGSLISDTFYNKIDRNLVRPFWNFLVVMNDIDSFVMPEDIGQFSKELG